MDKKNTSGCPCKGCENVGCGAKHSTCEKYIEWRKKLDVKRKKAQEYQQNMHTISADFQRDLWRRQRYSNQHRFRNGKRDDR